jgi:hypothetical protein
MKTSLILAQDKNSPNIHRSCPTKIGDALYPDPAILNFSLSSRINSVKNLDAMIPST